MRIAVVLVALAACTPSAAPKDGGTSAPKSGDDDPDIAQVKGTGAAERALVVDTGDLDAVQKRKVLRVLVFGGGETVLPRAGASTTTDRELAASFAESLGVE